MQLVTSGAIHFFDSIFRKKFKFEKYKSNEKPTVFLGLYSNRDRDVYRKHNGIKIVYLNGTDSTYEPTINTLINHPADAVIAGSKWISDDLDAVGIKYKKISLFLDDIYNWKVEPLGKSLYWYSARNSKYGKKYLRSIQRAIPDLDIIILDQKQIPREEMVDIYKKCFAGIRPVEHDGQSHTVVEMGLMGRLSIWNGQTPFSMGYSSFDDMIDLIQHLRKGYNHKLVARRTELFLREQEAMWADLILSLCGPEEIDCTGVFNEDIGRCGSIFRIQRKKDIEKIGGLGTEQFERPWFSGKMQEIGKKQLITSKSSGWIAKEWKSGKNKGYPEKTKFHTYDEKYD